jgi:hypothetical protein
MVPNPVDSPDREPDYNPPGDNNRQSETQLSCEIVPSSQPEKHRRDENGCAGTGECEQSR